MECVSAGWQPVVDGSDEQIYRPAAADDGAVLLYQSHDERATAPARHTVDEKSISTDECTQKIQNIHDQNLVFRFEAVYAFLKMQYFRMPVYPQMQFAQNQVPFYVKQDEANFSQALHFSQAQMKKVESNGSAEKVAGTPKLKKTKKAKKSSSA